MMCVLVKVLYWSQDFPWIPTWVILHLIAVNWLGNILDTQRRDDTLYWVKLAIVSTSILGRWRSPYKVMFQILDLHFVACKSTGSYLLQKSILIWRAVSVSLLSLGGSYSSFRLFFFGSGNWFYSRRSFSFRYLLTRWRCYWQIFCCPRNNV